MCYFLQILLGQVYTNVSISVLLLNEIPPTTRDTFLPLTGGVRLQLIVRWMIYAKSAKYPHSIIFFTTIVIFVDKICTLTSLTFSAMWYSMSFSILRQNQFPFYMDIHHQVLLLPLCFSAVWNLPQSHQ